MTQETTAQKMTVLDAFLKQREKRQNTTGIEAKRLVNLYRQLPLFGEGFLETYNKMLLDASADVQMALPDIIGGAVVRQYLEFLKGNKDFNEASDDTENASSYEYHQEESYLPDADEVPPYQFSPVSVPVAGGQGGVNEQMLKVQTDFFEQALAKQSQFFAQALEKMQEKIAQQLTSSAQNNAIAPEFEAFEKTQKEAIAEILTQQNKQLSDSLKNILNHTQEISSRQLEVFEKILKEATAKRDATAAPYDVIEEVMNAREQAAAMATAEPKEPKTYTPQPFKQPEVAFEPVDTPAAPVPQVQLTQGAGNPDDPDVKG